LFLLRLDRHLWEPRRSSKQKILDIGNGYMRVTNGGVNGAVG